MPFTLTPDMSLPVPVVGQEPGPQYATDVNNCLTIIDGHTHLPGSGVYITPGAININSSLSMNDNALINIGALTLEAQASVPANSSLYESGVDLYFVDGSGNNIRITQSGSVTGSAGTITGLPSGTASASYAGGTFTFQSATNTAANIDAGSYIFRNGTPSSFGLTLQPPSALGSNYTLTLPRIPTQPEALVIDTSGNITPALLTPTYLDPVTVAQALNPSGAITMYGGATAPTGYLLCDGTAYSRTTYSTLFTAIGTNYGNGDGSTTFNVPDLRGIFPRGVDSGAGNDPDANSRTSVNGGNSGDNVGSAQGFAIQNHSHSFVDPGHLHSINSAASGSTTTAPPQRLLDNPFNAGTTTTFNSNTATTGASVGLVFSGPVSTETRPINLYVNFIIKT